MAPVSSVTSNNARANEKRLGIPFSSLSARLPLTAASCHSSPQTTRIVNISWLTSPNLEQLAGASPSSSVENHAPFQRKTNCETA